MNTHLSTTKLTDGAFFFCDQSADFCGLRAIAANRKVAEIEYGLLVERELHANAARTALWL